MAKSEVTVSPDISMPWVRLFAGLSATLHLFPAIALAVLLLQIVREDSVGSDGFALLVFWSLLMGPPIAQCVFSMVGSRIGLVLAAGALLSLDGFFVYHGAGAVAVWFAVLGCLAMLAQVAIVLGAYFNQQIDTVLKYWQEASALPTPADAAESI